MNLPNWVRCSCVGQDGTTNLEDPRISPPEVRPPPRHGKGYLVWRWDHGGGGGQLSWFHDSAWPKEYNPVKHSFGLRGITEGSTILCIVKLGLNRDEWRSEPGSPFRGYPVFA
jgi:hypothetical protein